MKCTHDTLTSTESYSLRLCDFERETLREIYGPLQKTGEGTVKYIQEMFQLYRLPDILAR